MSKKALSFVFDNFVWLFGCVLYSTGVTIFAVPNNIAQSGMTGVSIILNYLFDTPIGTVNFLLNVPLFLLSWFFIGKSITVRTLWVTAMLSAVIDFMSELVSRGVLPVYDSGDRLLACIFCGILCGFGLALVFLKNATTGGTDIIVRLIKRKLPHFSIGRLIMLLDAVIVASAAVVYKSFEGALYAAVLIFISSTVVDRVLYGAGNGKILLGFTEKAHEVSQKIVSNMRRGVSIVPVEGGYTGDSKNMLIVVVRSDEVARVRRLIKEADAETFIVITEAKEILGEGFKPPLTD